MQRSKARKYAKGWYPRRYDGTLRRGSDSENAKTTRNEAREEGWLHEGERQAETDRERGDEGAMETGGCAGGGERGRAVERQGRTRGWCWAPDDLKRSCD